MKTNINVNGKLQYRQLLELGLIVSLASNIFLFQSNKKLDFGKTMAEFNVPEIILETPPVTRSEKIALPPSRPTVVVPTENEDIPETVTIPPTFLTDDPVYHILPPPLPPEPEESIIFTPYDQPPTPIGGYTAILNNLIYPDMAKMIGIEGTVIVHALIDENGMVISTRILQSLGSYGCDEAAENAVRSVKWNPAYQRDIPVKVWVAIPITFQLADSQ